jgi:RimJ/RimL family protein N-acetyltransferase
MTILATERLRMRPLTRDDVDSWLELHSDPEVAEFLGTYTRESATARLASIEEEWKVRGFGHFALERREDGQFIGRCGLKYWEQFDEAGISAVLMRQYRGHGYLTEAARAYISWGFDNLKLDTLIATVRDDNPSTQKLVTGLGFHPDRPEILFGHAITIYVLHSTDPRPGQPPAVDGE